MTFSATGIREPIELNSKALMLREQLGEDRQSPIQIFSIISKIEHISLTYYPLSDKVSGICVRAGDEKLVVINSMLTQGRQRFTAAHELYHIYEQKGFRNVVCPSGIGTSKEPEEINADNFASFFLAPYEALRLYIFKDLRKESAPLDLKDIITIEQYFQMSHQATLYRLYKEKWITQDQLNGFNSGIKTVARALGYDTDLYDRQTNSELAKRRTYGSYIALVNQLLESETISRRKADEYLLAAFREDIVDGKEEEASEVYD